MRTVTFTPPLFGLVVGTRAMLAAGVSLLLADRLDRGQRRAVGWTLAAIGVVTTVPLVLEVLATGGLQNRRSPLQPVAEDEAEGLEPEELAWALVETTAE